MTHHNTALHQLLKPWSRHGFEKLAKQHHQGQKLRAVSRWDQCIGMILGQLSGRQSLRDIEANLRSQHHQLYHPGAKPIARTFLARLNEKQPYELYESLFHQLLKQLSFPSGQHKFRFKNPLYSLDASLISLSLHLFPWTKTQTDKAAVKLHVGLNNSDAIPEFIALGEGREGGLIQGRQFDFPPGSIVACDKGYVDYGWYKSLADKGIFFVTRLRPNAIYRVIERETVDKKTGVTSDQTSQLNSAHAIKQRAPILHRVAYHDKDTGQHYINQFTLSARTIAATYKERWQVELFFKAIKQNLKIKSFLGTSKNAIMTPIWVAMCTYLLLAYTRFASKTVGAISRIVKVLQLNLFERRSLYQLLKPPGAQQQKSEPQMRLAL